MTGHCQYLPMADSGLVPMAGLGTPRETVPAFLGFPFLLRIDPTAIPVSALARNLVLSHGAQAKMSPRVHFRGGDVPLPQLSSS